VTSASAISAGPQIVPPGRNNSSEIGQAHRHIARGETLEPPAQLPHERHALPGELLEFFGGDPRRAPLVRQLGTRFPARSPFVRSGRSGAGRIGCAFPRGAPLRAK
jgi:hypothetical protein